MKSNIYEHQSLTRLILIFGIPSTLSLMMEMLTGMADTAFAGHLPGIGDGALSAMALLSPVLGIFTALQTLFSMSTGLLIARYLNEADRKNRSYTAGVVMSLVMPALVALLCRLTLPELLSALGARGQVFELARQYLEIQLISNLFSSVGYTLTCCIRAFGFPKIEVAIVSSAVVVNLVCNFLFAFRLDMGMSGLAWGTFVSESVCAGASLLFLIKKKLWLQKCALSAADFFRSVAELFKIGIAQTAIQLLGGCTGFVINARLLCLGSMAHVAAWSVVQRIYTFVLIPIVGLTQGVQNIISYFSGNGAQQKIEMVSRRTMLFCGSYGILALGGMILFGQNLASVFGGSREIVTIASGILFVVFLGFPLIGVLYTEMTLLQVTGHEVASVLLILSRQVFFLIPLVYIVPTLAALGPWELSPVLSLFFCMPLADLLAVLFARAMKRRRADALLRPDAPKEEPRGENR